MSKSEVSIGLDLNPKSAIIQIVQKPKDPVFGCVQTKAEGVFKCAIIQIEGLGGTFNHPKIFWYNFHFKADFLGHANFDALVNMRKVKKFCSFTPISKRFPIFFANFYDI